MDSVPDSNFILYNLRGRDEEQILKFIDLNTTIAFLI